MASDPLFRKVPTTAQLPTPFFVCFSEQMELENTFFCCLTGTAAQNHEK